MKSEILSSDPFNLRRGFVITFVFVLISLSGVACTHKIEVEPVRDPISIIDLRSPAHHVSIRDNYAYIGAGAKLAIKDLTNFDDPEQLRQPFWLQGATDDLIGLVLDVELAGDYAYVAAERGLCVINIANPANPTGSCYDVLGQGRFIVSVAVAGNYAFLAEFSRLGDGVPAQYIGGGLHIFDIANPMSPEIKTGGVVRTFKDSNVMDVMASGDYVYVVSDRQETRVVEGFSITTTETSLHIIDVSGPSPRMIGQLGLPTGSSRAAVEGNYAYVANFGGELTIIDVTNPQKPVEVGSDYEPSDIIYGVTVSGDLVYIGGKSGLRILSVRDPAEPKEVGFYDTSDSLEFARTIAVDGDYIYIAGGRLLILRKR